MRGYSAKRLYSVIEADRKGVATPLKSLLTCDLSEVLSSYFEGLSGVEIKVITGDKYEITVTAKAKRLSPRPEIYENA